MKTRPFKSFVPIGEDEFDEDARLRGFGECVEAARRERCVIVGRPKFTLIPHLAGTDRRGWLIEGAAGRISAPLR